MPLFLVVMFTVMFALPAAGAAVVPSSAFAQEEDDVSSFGEDLSSSILSNVLQGDGDGSGDASDDATTELNQEATNTATEDSNQGQTVDQDDISTFGDDSADLIQDQRQANVAVPIAIPINVQLEEEEEEEPPGPTPECPSGFTFNPDTDQCE
jgi:hypothetical protein